MKMRYYLLRRWVYFSLLAAFLPAPAASAQDQPEVPSRAVEQLDFANGLFERQMYGMALTEYLQLVEQFPQSAQLADAYLGIGESYFFQKNDEPAVEAYRKYLTLDPPAEGETLVKLRLGQSLVRLGRFKEASGYLGQVVTDKLNESQRQVYYFYHGRACQMTGEETKALEFYYKATESNDAAGALAVLSYFNMGEISAARKEYPKAVNFYQRAYDRAVSAEQKSAALYKKGEAQYSGALYEEARDTLSTVVREFAGEAVFREALGGLLSALDKLEDYQSAVEVFAEHRARISLQEDFVPVYLQVVSAHARLGRHDAALEVISPLLEIEGLTGKSRRRLLLARTRLLAESGQYDQALEVIEGGLVTDEEAEPDPEVTYLRAEAYYGLGQFQRAAWYYRKITEQDVEADMKDGARYGLAYAAHSAGDLKVALDEFVNYFKTGRDAAKQEQALHNVILLSARLDLISESIDYSQIYLTRFPDNGRAESVLYFLGGLRARNKQFQDAIDIYKRYLVSYPDSPRIHEVYFLLAFNSQTVGQYEQARLYYEKAAGDPADKDRRYSALKNLAVVHLVEGRPEKAAEVFGRIINEFESNDLALDTYLWLAEHHLARGNFPLVLEITGQVSKNPGLEDPVLQLVFFQAEAFRNLKQHAEAVQAYDRMIAAGPGNPFEAEAKLGRALSLAGMENFEDARPALAGLIEEQPDNHSLLMKARFALGELEELAGETEEAIKYYMLVAVLYQSDDYAPRALGRAALLLESLGRTAEALRNYEEIISAYPEGAEAVKAHERIQALGAK
jgi:tetratricopeptide (TPR) repeat protein